MFLFCSLQVKPPDAVGEMDRATALQAREGKRRAAQWAHEIKLDGYRVAARIEDGRVKLLTRSGLDWTAKYPPSAAAFAKLKVTYLDGELRGVRPDDVTSFELMQQITDCGGSSLVYFAFDLLELDGEDITRARARMI
jgi:bifunctional non-homologous end joining protein LigD